MSPEEKLKEFENKFEEDRTEWTDKIKELVGKLQYVEGLEMTMTYMLSYRQIIVDKISNLSVALKHIDGVFSKKYREKYIGYYNYDIKLSYQEKQMMCNADLVSVLNKIELIKTQIEFYRESIKTLDNLGFAIKNRISITEI